jgi:hypothetical protein
MSGITSVSNTTPSLIEWLAQAEQDGTDDPTLLDSLLANETQTAASDPTTATTGAGATDGGTSDSGRATSTDLENQVQSAVASAMDSADQAGGDLKTAIYNALVGVLQQNGIDPRTLQGTTAGQSGNTGGSGDTQSSSSAISSSTKDVLTQVMTALSSAQSSSNLFSLLSNNSSGSQNSTDLLSQLAASASNNSNPLGFLFDSGQ